VNPMTASLQADMERAAAQVFRQLPPGLTVPDALAEDEPGLRNLMLRKALGLEFPGRRGELVKVDQAGVVQVVQRNLTAARRVERLLIEGLDESWTVALHEPPGGGWLVAAYPHVEGDAGPLPDLEDLLGRDQD
jgi:hypothetical protein